MFYRMAFALFAFFVIYGLVGSAPASAATTPSLGVADTFGVLANTFARNFSGTVITGDLGYTTFSGTGTYTVNGTTHAADGTYNQAVTDRNTALAALNSQPCTFTFPSGSVDLATDTSHGPLGVYAPGVYCVTSMVPSVSIGAAGITLSGSGTYIFRFNGSLTTATNSHVTLENGASPCNVFWTLTDNVIVSSLGATSTFSGTLFDTVSLSMHNNVTWTGRALLSGGTVGISYDDQISVPTACTTPPPATLHIIKRVVNNDGGTATASTFTLHVKGTSSMGGAVDVVGSPAAGSEAPGKSYTLTAGTYVVSEDAYNGYTATYSGDCDASGVVTLTSGADKTCTITNNDNPQPPPLPATLQVIKHVINNDGSKEIASDFIVHVKGSGASGLVDVTGSPAAGTELPGTSYSLVAGTYIVSEDAHAGYSQSFSGDCDASGVVTLSAGDGKTCTITNDDIATETPPPPTPSSATLHVIKTVINDNGGTAVSSDAIVHVSSGSGDVAGSPQAGMEAPGTVYVLNPGAYVVSENFFAGYTVKIGGDCDAGGDVVLTPGDNKTCTIINNDIAEAVVPPTTITTTITPPISKPPCDICALLTYDVYIINPDGSQRHTGTPWVKVTDRGNGIKRYSFEDATLDPKNPLFDHNDSVIDVDLKDCRGVIFMFVSSDASWKHQVRIKVSIDGVAQSDVLVANDSRSVVGTSKAINATTGVNDVRACSLGMSSIARGLLGRILLQVQAHGEAWYIHPGSGRRYYMKDGATAYGMMRNFGLGITDKNLAAIPSVATVDELKKLPSVCASNSSANKVKGWILLQVQAHGEAWYVDATKCRRIYMKDGAAAYTLMRFLGLGITDVDLVKLNIGQQ
ncbi:MAG: ice-binding family protein [Candidatus Uhrbacteria bacterium]|nr:ice-binding family protein [Candidatus Uhrbacteria bacterium]